MGWLRAALALAWLCAAAGCGPGPTPSPEGMTGVLNELAAHGAPVSDVLAGDAGCADQTLVGNASRLTLRLATDGRDYEVYLLRWRRATDFEAAADAFDQCVTDFLARRGPPVETVVVSPWRAYGPSWSAELRQAVEQALVAAAGGG